MLYEVITGVGDQSIDTAVVGGRKGKQADLVVACPGRDFLQESEQSPWIPFPDGAVDVPCLAEPAPAGAPAGDLDAEAVA